MQMEGQPFDFVYDDVIMQLRALCAELEELRKSSPRGKLGGGFQQYNRKGQVVNITASDTNTPSPWPSSSSIRLKMCV